MNFLKFLKSMCFLLYNPYIYLYKYVLIILYPFNMYKMYGWWVVVNDGFWLVVEL